MIDVEVLFNEISDALAISVPDGVDTGDLVRVAEMVIERAVTMVSVHPESVGPLWTWLEDKPVKIIARFDLNADMSKLSTDINAAFKRGANGAQVYIPFKNFKTGINDMLAVRDDLFFNKDLLISTNLNDVAPDDWSDLFAHAIQIRASALVFDVPAQKNPDFVGRVYALLHAVPDDFGPDLYFVLDNDYEKIEQGVRLFEKMRPDFLKKLKILVQV